MALIEREVVKKAVKKAVKKSVVGYTCDICGFEQRQRAARVNMESHVTPSGVYYDYIDLCDHCFFEIKDHIESFMLGKKLYNIEEEQQ